MRNWLLAAVVALPVSLCAQATVNVTPEQCVYKVGDDPRWAATDLDESGWTPETQYKLTGDMTVVWLRCHTNTNLTGAQQPAVWILAVDSAMQAFVNGRPIGGIAGPRAGYASEETLEKEVLPLPPALAFPVRTIAVRVTPGRVTAGNSLFPFLAYTFPGDRESLVNLAVRNADPFWGAIPVYSCFLVIGSAGLFLLGLFLFDHSQKPALWLGIYCCSVSLARVSSLCMGQAPQIPVWVDEIVWAAANIESYALVLVIFALVYRRVPRIYWVLPATVIVLNIGSIAAILLPPHWSLPLSFFVQVTCFKPMWSIFALSGTAPFVAFWPWTKVQGRMRIVAPLCALWGLLEAAFYLGQVIFGRDSWHGPIQTWWSLSILIVIVALVGYIFQDQRATADQRAKLGGELNAARKVQRTLMPEELDVAPGMALSAAFLPASEVGGDFYRCRTLKDGSQRVLLGDVSGKGVAAALTSALLLGAADRCDDLPPASVLKVLNLTLRQSAIGGFTTCLCADVSPTGSLRIANAGHLSPYRNGAELPVSNGLPLGLVDRIDYPQTPLQLDPGDTLTFLSDGVVEARNAKRELFGFERTRQMSTLTARQLAEAARQFGQEDDITVLTLTLTGAAVLARVLV
jgi:hypothetical protein